MNLITLRKIPLLLSSMCLLVLAGCGGSGGSSGQQSSPKDQSLVTADSSSSLEMTPLSTEAEKINLKPFSSKTIDTVVSPADFTGQSGQIKTYTPADIRTAYKLPQLPASWTQLTELQKAQMGAGQTVYVVNAFHNPNIVEELRAFNDEFKLPSCTTVSIPVNTPLPLAAADKNAGCEFSVVYSNQNTLSVSAPLFNSGWAEEIALDVQWVHATAPLARIILIEAPDALVSSLLSAINLANAMGPGVVSMSFGANEGNWTSSVDSSFSAADMTYVAATGDSGAEVNWPSVSSRVLAVGGTSLKTFDANGRTETSWSRTGGGVSVFVNLPDYQKPAYSNSKLQVLSGATKRNVADVAFNADPDTGQYVATIANGKVTWRRFGGTSIAAPQWAGITAITNATRALNGQGPIGLVQNLLYRAAGSVSDFFSSVVNDVQTRGVDQSNNTELTTSVYYDLATGLGTPNVKSFMDLAGGDGSNSAQSPVPPSPVKPSPPVDKPISSAPVVSDVSLDGIAGSSLAFSLSLSAPNPVTWTLPDAPSGMQIDNSGLVKWPEPIAGKYTATAVATDNVTGLIGKGKVSFNISPANNAVQMEPINIAGQEGKLLIFKVRAQPAYSLSFALDKNAPAGLSLIAHSGTMIWEKPLAGTYDFKVIATDKKTLATTSDVLPEPA